MVSEFWYFFARYINLAWDTVMNFDFYHTGFTVGDFVIGFIVIKFILLIFPALFGGSSSDDD